MTHQFQPRLLLSSAIFALIWLSLSELSLSIRSWFHCSLHLSLCHLPPPTILSAHHVTAAVTQPTAHQIVCSAKWYSCYDSASYPAACPVARGAPCSSSPPCFTLTSLVILLKYIFKALILPWHLSLQLSYYWSYLPLVLTTKFRLVGF